MKKCDFCKSSLPNGECYWKLRENRKDDCEKAIAIMVDVLKSTNSKDNKRKIKNRR